MSGSSDAVAWLASGSVKTQCGAAKARDELGPPRYSINVTLDGCCHHEAGLPPDEESMRYWAAEIERADALLFIAVTSGQGQ